MNEQNKSKGSVFQVNRLAEYLYEVRFDEISSKDVGDFVVGGCTSFVKDGKLYRNLDWTYDESASFHVICPSFEGMSFLKGLTKDHIDDELIGQLPYRVVDGVNKHGIMMSTHVLYNDWNVKGKGSIPLTTLPYLVLTNVQTMDTIHEDLSGILTDLYVPDAMTKTEYLIQVFVTDGNTSCVLRPTEAPDCVYEIVDVTANPKLTNFRWVDKKTVSREELQRRPTGVERWNMIPAELSSLRFTEAYMSPVRLSEFIGEKGTTNVTPGRELAKLFTAAHELYAKKKRDGSTWQTMHSAVYSPGGLEHLWIQENWDEDFIDALSHSGIKGMRWGRRRYQYEDGSLTPEGVERYRKGRQNEAAKKQRKTDIKNRRSFSDAELNARIERINLEQKFKAAAKNDVYPGRKFVGEVLSSVGKKTLTTVLTGATMYGIAAAVAGSFDKKELAASIFSGGNNKNWNDKGKDKDKDKDKD